MFSGQGETKQVRTAIFIVGNFCLALLLRFSVKVKKKYIEHLHHLLL